MKKNLCFAMILFLCACQKDRNAQETPSPEVVLTAINTMTDKQNHVYRVGYDQVTSIVKATFLVSRTTEGNHNAVDKTNSFSPFQVFETLTSA